MSLSKFPFATVSGGLHDVGVGFRATVGEVGGQVGGAFGVGGKLGLSADSEVGIGSNGLRFKVLGTGVTLTSEKGFEVCFWGSCINIG